MVLPLRGTAGTSSRIKLLPALPAPTEAVHTFEVRECNVRHQRLERRAVALLACHAVARKRGGTDAAISKPGMQLWRQRR